MAAYGGLLGLVYRQIHPGFCGSGHVWGPVIRHIPSLVPSVPIVPMGRHRLVCDGPRLWPPVEDCLDRSIDKSIQVSVGAAMSWGQWYFICLALCIQYLEYWWVHRLVCNGPWQWLPWLGLKFVEHSLTIFKSMPNTNLNTANTVFWIPSCSLYWRCTVWALAT